MTRSASAISSSMALSVVGAAAEDVVEIGEAIGAIVEDDGAGAHAHRDLGGVDTHGAAADDDDLRRRDAGDAAEQHAAAAVLLLQVHGAGLDGQATGDLAHREEERVAAAGELDRLVGDGADVCVEHALGEVLGVGRGQMQVRVEDLALLEHGPLDRQRLFDLDDHVGLGEDVCDLGQRGAGGLVGGVVEAAADAGAVLYEDGVASAHELLDAVRRDRNAVLLVLDLLGDTDDHDSSSLLIPIVTLLMRTRVRTYTV